MPTERKYKTREARDYPGHSHLLTFSTRKRRPHLRDEQICHWLAESINRAKGLHNFQVLAYVFMPDHVHILIRPQEETYKIAEILRSMKQPVSRKARNAAMIDDVLWEPGGGHDKNITTTVARANAIEYIHRNPLRKALCQDILEYRWTSARAILLGEESEIGVDGSY